MESPLLNPAMTVWIVIARRTESSKWTRSTDDCVEDLVGDAIKKFPWRVTGGDGQVEEVVAESTRCLWTGTKGGLLTFVAEISLPPITARRVYGAGVVLDAIARYIRRGSWMEDDVERGVHSLEYSLRFTSGQQAI